jgi:CBS domain-containing protein
VPSSLAFPALPGVQHRHDRPSWHSKQRLCESLERRPSAVCGRWGSSSATSTARMHEESAAGGAEPDSSSVVRRDGLALSKDEEHKEESHRRRLSEVSLAFGFLNALVHPFFAANNTSWKRHETDVAPSGDSTHVRRTRFLPLQVLISEVVEAKHSYRWVDPVISQNATVREAIVSTIEGGLSGMMVLGEGNHVVGLLTSRDLLRIIASGIVEEESNDQVLQKVVKDHMTPISQVIYARPDETVGMCRTIMAKLGIKCLPILAKDGRVAGVITAKDISNFGLTAKDRGGKESYLNNVAQRVGLSVNTRYVVARTSQERLSVRQASTAIAYDAPNTFHTSMADPPSFMRASPSIEQSPLFVNIGKAMLPHPFKTHETVGRNQKGTSPGARGNTSRRSGSWTTRHLTMEALSSPLQI